MGALRDHIEMEIEVIECLLQRRQNEHKPRCGLGQGLVYLPRPSLALLDLDFIF